MIGSIDDHLTRAGDAARLNRAEADGAGTEDHDVGAGLEVHVGMAGGKARRQLIAEQRELRGRQIGEDRHAVLLERRHDLAHAADAGLRVDRRAVAHLGERRKRLDARRIREERELAVVGAAVQALIALSALRGAGDDDAVADLHALDHRAHRLDDAEAAMVRDLGAADRVGAERAAHDRVARRHGRGADDDLPRIDRQQPQLLNVERAVVADESAERPARLRAGEHGRRLRVLRADGWHASEKSRAAAERGCSRLQNTPARQTPFAVRLGSHAALR